MSYWVNYETSYNRVADGPFEAQQAADAHADNRRSKGFCNVVVTDEPYKGLPDRAPKVVG